MRRRPLALLASFLVGLVVLATSCSSVGGSGIGASIVVADDPGTGEDAAEVVDLWAVEPGEALDDDALIARDGQGPLTILTRTASGRVWANNLAREWRGEVLLGTTTPTGARVSVGTPGEKASTVAASDELEVLVVPRGVITFDAEGCSLTTEPGETERVGAGSCSISDDGRWVASWPADGGPLEIRDLRSGKIRTIDGSFTQAVAMGRDARVLAVGADGDTAVARVYDAVSGDPVGEPFRADFLQAAPSNPGSEGFALVAQSADEPSLVWMDTAGRATTVATSTRGEPLLPVTTGEGMHYLRLDANPLTGTLMYWKPGGERTKLVEGAITATAYAPDGVLVTRQRGDHFEIWHTVAADRLADEPDLDLDLASEDRAQIGRVVLHGDVAHMELGTPGSVSYVRVDLHGDDDDAPVRNKGALQLVSMDHSGTALLVSGADPTDSSAGSASSGEAQLLVVGPHDDTPHVRAEATTFGIALLHEGDIVYTTVDESGSEIWEVSSSGRGEPEPERLYRDKGLAGAVWPEFGGGDELFPIDGAELAAGASGG